MKKVIITSATVLALAAAASVTVLFASAEVTDVGHSETVDEANRSADFCETNQYYYYYSDAIYRVDKNDYSWMTVGEKTSDIVGRSDDTLYCTNPAGDRFVKLTDAKPNRFSYVGTCEKQGFNRVFADGKNVYYVYDNTAIKKGLVSDKYTKTADIYIPQDWDSHLVSAKMYNGYIYMIIDEGSATDKKQLAYVNLKTGGYVQFGEKTINEFEFTNNSIICKSDDGFFEIGYDGTDQKQFTDIKNADGDDFCLVGDILYYHNSSDKKIHAYNMNDGSDEAKNEVKGKLNKTSDGFVAIDGNELHIYDNDFNEKAMVKP